MSNLIGWTLVLIAVLLGLFLTDGPGAGANLPDACLSAGLFLKPKWLSDFLFIVVNGKFEANTPTGE